MKKPEAERGPASKPLTLYPLKLEEVVRDVLTMKPPKASKAKRPRARKPLS